MKKTLVSALTTALVVGAASTTFAAANPFSDVPADHWAYDAVSQLAADGVIEGYGDTTFRGNQNITRYEMAQMIAKAMAKSDVSAADKVLIDKLAAEFSDELNNLGVRVSNLERNADMVKWNGEARYRYWSKRVEDRDGVHNEAGKDKQNTDRLKLRLEPTAEVNQNWHVKARLDADINTSKDTGATGDVKLARVYAQGDYKNFQVKLGKQALFSTETNGLVLDDDFSGAQVTFGKDLKTTLEAGRWDLDNADYAVSTAAAAKDSAANYQGIMLNYAPNKLSLGAGYRHFGSDAFTKVASYNNSSSKSDDANIWSVGAGYRFDRNWNLEGAFAKNDEADNYNTAHNIQLSYKGADRVNAGTWGLYGAYRYLGENVAFAPTYDTALNNTKGWEVGADYTPFHNVYTAVSYFDGKQLARSDKDAKVLFGRVSFFF
ncbi:porin [uncultured Mitsuokella sp.]|uniref:porin n=1 Tax=uncultured Mitsuokella sp. TaxID=453120 RepID=UPI0025E2A333|nr:porin [uncultured Mitsuokella sp.]